MKIPLFNLGFRPFFLFAGLYAVLSVLFWSIIYSTEFKLPSSSISVLNWHSHEMIYGYSLAVIAGFLLTASRNWTGIQTIHGTPLLLLTCIWIIARIFFNLGVIVAACISDLLFMFFLLVTITYPILKAGQWKNMVVVSILLLLFICNLFFYLGALGIAGNGIYLGIYGGLYLVVALILIIGRRVMPFFIERGVEYPVKLYNHRILDLTSLILIILFVVFDLTNYSQILSAYIAFFLFIINAARLIGWHTYGIWQRPLLWSLYLGMWFICLGFLLYSLGYLAGISKFIAIHAFSYGGIGCVTLAMMSRVALGHTGRDIRKPPYAIGLAFAILLSGAVTRVIFPLISPSYYDVWIFCSQVLWMIAFLLYTYLYFPMLVRERIDGEFG